MASRSDLQQRPIRLLLIHPTYAPGWTDGGPVVAVTQLAQHLARAGARVMVLTTDRDRHGRRYARPGAQRLNGVVVIYCPRWWPWYYCFAPRHVKYAFRLFKWADIVCLMSVFNFTALYTSILTRILRTPVVISPRGNFSPIALLKSRYLKKVHALFFEKPLLRAALFVHCTSPLDLAWAKQYCSSRRYVVLPNGVTSIGESAAPGLRATAPTQSEADTRTVLYLGRFAPIKNLEALVSAFAALQLKDLRLFLAGADTSDYSRQIEKRCRGDRSITVLPFLREDLKSHLLRSADVLVLPSKSENFGNVVLEAFLAETPVVVTENAGIAELVRQTGAGKVVAPTVEGIKEGLAEVLTNLNAYRLSACQARVLIESNLTWKAIALRFLAECQRALVTGAEEGSNVTLAPPFPDHLTDR